MRTWVSALFLSSLLAACDSTSDPLDGGADAGAADAGGCACSAEEYCCIDRCQPLGTTCGMARDAGSDAQIDPCDLGRARPGGSGEAPQEALCLGAGLVRLCEQERDFACNDSYPDCQSWYDEERDVFGATCFAPGGSACSADDPPVACDGDVLVTCNENINYPTTGPAYQRTRFSCTEAYGTGAVCVTEGGDGPRCDRPDLPACDPETFRLECTADLSGFEHCGPLDRVVTLDCGAGNRCLDNASTREAGGVGCIPSDATPSDHGPSIDPSYLACESSTRIRVEQHGFEWTETCEPSWTFVPDGSGGFREELVDQVCYAGAGGVRCEHVGTAHCDPETYDAACGEDGTSVRTCEVDLVATRQCSTVGLEYPCDPETVACAPVEACNGTFPYTSRCVLGGAYHMVCHPTEGIAIAEPCAGCVEEAGGTTRCE